MGNGDEGEGSDVFLNVYDISPAWLNDALSLLGVGVYHTGVEVYGKEHGFGRSLDSSGVYSITPKTYEAHFFKESVWLGRTQRSREDVIALTHYLEKVWLSDKYHVLRRNCNDFSEGLCRHLLGKSSLDSFPLWVNRPCRIGGWLLPDDAIAKIDEIDFEIFQSWRDEQLKLQQSYRRPPQHLPPRDPSEPTWRSGVSWVPCQRPDREESERCPAADYAS